MGDVSAPVARPGSARPSPLVELLCAPPLLASLLLAGCGQPKSVEVGDSGRADSGADPGSDSGGDPAAPSIVVDPASVRFDALAPGDAPTATVTVSNAGDAALALAGVTVEGAGWSLTAPPPDGVAAGGSTTFVLAFSATSAGSFDGTATVRSDDPARPEVVVPLAAEVLGASLRVEPTAVAWGTGELGGVFATPVTLANAGAVPLTVYAVEMLGSVTLDAGDFASPDVTLDPGEAGELTVRWAPAAAGCVEASLIVRSDAPDGAFVVVPVTGCAEAAEGARTVGVELTADDSWTAWLDGVELEGVASGTWSTTDGFERTLAPGEHVLAVHGVDALGTIAGVLAAITVDGTVAASTGDGAWRVATAEESGWTDVSFDDTAWSLAPGCADDRAWGGQPASLRATGAAWIWWTPDCTRLGEAWLRRRFTVE